MHLTQLIRGNTFFPGSTGRTGLSLGEYVELLSGVIAGVLTKEGPDSQSRVNAYVLLVGLNTSERTRTLVPIFTPSVSAQTALASPSDSSKLSRWVTSIVPPRLAMKSRSTSEGMPNAEAEVE